MNNNESNSVIYKMHSAKKISNWWQSPCWFFHRFESDGSGCGSVMVIIVVAVKTIAAGEP